MKQDKSIKNWGVSVLQAEAEAVLHLSKQLDEHFVRACRRLIECSGRIVLMGVGKSAYMAGKIASTLSSIGSASFFVHPNEAGHGDLGMIKSEDVVLILSNSGESKEINVLLPALKEMEVTVIAMGSRPQSSLAQMADIYLNTHANKEACPLGLAPTSSSTAALALGDALAMAVLQARQLKREDFARTHPQGRLGRQLILRIDSLMRTAQDIPQVKSGTPLLDALCVMSEKRMGMTLITNEAGRPVGIFTDGDLRRALEKKIDIQHSPVDDAMTVSFYSVRTRDLAMDVLKKMEEKSVNSAPVLDENGALVGAISIHILLQAGL